MEILIPQILCITPYLHLLIAPESVVDAMLDGVDLVLHRLAEVLPLQDVLVDALEVDVVVPLEGLLHEFEVDYVQVDEVVADQRVALLEVFDVLVVQQVPQLEEVFSSLKREEVVVFLQGLLGVLDHLVLRHEGAQAQVFVELLQVVGAIELHPIVSFLRVVLEHAEDHLSDLHRQVLVHGLYLAGKLHIKLEIDHVAEADDFRPHFLRGEEGKGDFALSLAVEKLVGDDAQGPDVHLFVVEALGVDLGSIVPDCPHAGLGRIDRFRRDAQIANHTPPG